MGPSIIYQKTHFPAFLDPTRSVFQQSIPQAIELLTVKGSRHCGIGWKQLPVYDALEIPKNRQHQLLFMDIIFWFWNSMSAKRDPLALARVVDNDLVKEPFHWI